MAALLLQSFEQFDRVSFELLDRARPRSVLELTRRGTKAARAAEHVLGRYQSDEKDLS